MVTLNRVVRPDVNQLKLPPTAAERQREGFTGAVHKSVSIMFLKSINKMKEKAFGVKLSF